VQQILEHEALVDREVGCLVDFNTTLNACRRALLDGELVAARTLEFLAELGEDRGHVAGTQDLDVRGMSPRQRSKQIVKTRSVVPAKAILIAFLTVLSGIPQAAEITRADEDGKVPPADF
jgi:hypothetical protein